MKKLLLGLLIGSLVLNAFAFLRIVRVPDITFVVSANANSRPTYFSVHNLEPVRKVASGRGVRVGVLDHYFGYGSHEGVYAGGVDFLDDSSSFRSISEHGFWMASVLREIAPDCEVFALNTTHGDPGTKVEAMVKAIDWALAEEMDILTYSGPLIPVEYRQPLDSAVQRAHAAGIVMTFIHYDHEANLFPDGLFPFDANVYGRQPDVNILHYDYGVLYLPMYERYAERTVPPVSGDGAPYFSLSSTSPVCAGFVALLKEVRGDLTPDQYRQVLRMSAAELDFDDPVFERRLHADRAVDLGRAMEELQRF